MGMGNCFTEGRNFSSSNSCAEDYEEYLREAFPWSFWMHPMTQHRFELCSRVLFPQPLFPARPISHPRLSPLGTFHHAERENAKVFFMIPILRRLSKSVPAIDPLSKLMDASSSFGGSRRLAALAQQLRLYKAPPTLEDINEQCLEETAGKVVSQVGFPESATPIAQDPESFRPKRAAVLVCLFEGDAGDLRVVLTKRSARLSTHSGEIALPGGKADEGDKDDVDTATREAREEIGLDTSLVNVVTVLEPFLSKHLLRVVPVIGILNEKKAFKPAPNPSEVEVVFDAPLEMFIKVS